MTVDDPHLFTARGLRRLPAGGFMFSDVMHIQSAIEPEQRSNNHLLLRSAPPPHEPHVRQSASDTSTDASKCAETYRTTRLQLHSAVRPGSAAGQGHSRCEEMVGHSASSMTNVGFAACK